MKILALDLGATTGWVVVDNNKVRNYGEKYFSGDRGHRLWQFQDWLHRAVHEFSHVDVLIFERPFCRGLAATRSLWGMAGVAEAEAHGQGITSLDIVPSTLKKWATGSGKASKEQMITAAVGKLFEQMREPPITLGEHEADAIILGLYAAEHIEPGE